jgi:hypothetical protein
MYLPRRGTLSSGSLRGAAEGIMRFRVILASALLAVTCRAANPGITAGECRDRIAPTILIRQVEYNLPLQIKARARFVAAQILRPAGIHLRWSASEFPPDLRRCASLVVVVDLGERVPSGRQVDVWGFASPYASSGSTIHVFWDRIERQCPKELWGHALGHVIAHEITHVLQGLARHSDEGVMKPHWDRSDLYGMTRRPLALTADDIDLIHYGLATFREKATVDSGPIGGH